MARKCSSKQTRMFLTMAHRLMGDFQVASRTILRSRPHTGVDIARQSEEHALNLFVDRSPLLPPLSNYKGRESFSRFSVNCCAGNAFLSDFVSVS
jgi:hypothetical protein